MVAARRVCGQCVSPNKQKQKPMTVSAYQLFDVDSKSTRQKGSIVLVGIRAPIKWIGRRRLKRRCLYKRLAFETGHRLVNL
jgi:hypothetical protein